MSPHDRRIATLPLALGVLCALVFAGLVVLYGGELRADIRRKMIERDAAVLSPVAQQQIESTASLAALLPDARRQGTLALAIFDEAGVTLETVPSNQPLAELPYDDLVQLQDGKPLTHFHSEFPLARLQAGVLAGRTSPVLEIILPLYRRPDSGGNRSLLGFVRYYLDARPLATELAALDENVARKTRFTLFLGVALIGLIVLAAHLILRRSQRTIAERTTRLQQANFELTLAVKASALGQITSHLIHGLKGSVSGLHAVVGSGDQVATAGYAERFESLIQEASDLLSDQSAQANYELTGAELAELIRRRNESVAAKHHVGLHVSSNLSHSLDSHCGGLLCLIINNLVHNAVLASPPGRAVRVELTADSDTVVATVSDEGPGIPGDLQLHLFTPGHSGRPGGTGLGLALSRLIARQISATLELISTGPQGTVFRVTLPPSGLKIS
ncbi:MAG: sensor histidine kinase [Lacunisphaera sp.]